MIPSLFRVFAWLILYYKYFLYVARKIFFPIETCKRAMTCSQVPVLNCSYEYKLQ